MDFRFLQFKATLKSRKDFLLSRTFATKIFLKDLLLSQEIAC